MLTPAPRDPWQVQSERTRAAAWTVVVCIALGTLVYLLGGGRS